MVLLWPPKFSLSPTLIHEYSFLQSVYFWPGTQSLGLTTEDLSWTGNKKWA
jgi:hypothetical protein